MLIFCNKISYHIKQLRPVLHLDCRNAATRPHYRYWDGKKITLHYTTRKDIVDKFNLYFSNIGNELSNSIDSANKTATKIPYSSCEKSIFLMPTRNEEIWKIINNQIQELTKLLSQIWKYSGYHRTDTTEHNKQQLYNRWVSGYTKACDHKFITQERQYTLKYWPNSLLSIFGQIYGNAVKNRLTDFITKTNLMYKQQYCFINNNKTEAATIDFMKYAYSIINRKKNCNCNFSQSKKSIWYSGS